MREEEGGIQNNYQRESFLRRMLFGFGDGVICDVP